MKPAQTTQTIYAFHSIQLIIKRKRKTCRVTDAYKTININISTKDAVLIRFYWFMAIYIINVLLYFKALISVYTMILR